MAHRLDDFDFETTCEALGASASTASPDATAASEIAGYALHYLFATGQLADFRSYLRMVREPVQNEIQSDHVFQSMEHAEQWLSSEPSPEWGVLIRVAGQTYTVAKRATTQRVLLPSFSPEELKPLEP